MLNSTNQLFKKGIKILIIGLLCFSFSLVTAQDEQTTTVEYNEDNIGVREDVTINFKEIDLLKKRISVKEGNTKSFYPSNFQINKTTAGSLKLERRLNGIQLTGKQKTDGGLSFKCTGDLMYATNDYSNADTKNYTGGNEFMYMKINFPKNSKDEASYYLQIGCQLSDQQKMSNPEENLGFTEKEVLRQKNNLTSMHIEDENGKIDETKIEGELLKPNPDKQPTFTDIVYLQLKTIGNLTKSYNSLCNQNLSGEFIGNGYYEYIQWNNKFSQFVDKQSFVDSLSGAINLKDVGIGNDVILGLTKKLNEIYNGSGCDKTDINIRKGYNNPYEFYKLGDIIDLIYNPDAQKSIGDQFLNLYENLKSIEDETGENDVAKNILSQILTGDISSLEDSDINKYDIGYGLQKRQKNLKKLKKHFLNNTGINLLGVYNFYYEINNGIKGAKNVSDIKKGLEDDNIENFLTGELPNSIIEEKADLKGDESKYELAGTDMRNDIHNDLIKAFFKDPDTTKVRNESECYAYNSDAIKTQNDKYKLLKNLVNSAFKKIGDEGNKEGDIILDLSRLKGTLSHKYIRNNCNFGKDGYKVKSYDYNQNYDYEENDAIQFQNLLTNSEKVGEQNISKQIDWDDEDDIPVWSDSDDESFLLKYIGFINFPTTGNYEFKIKADWYGALYLNDELIVEDTRDDEGNYSSSSINISQKERKSFRINFSQEHQGEYLTLKWKTPENDDYEVVPACAFGKEYTCEESTEIEWKEVASAEYETTGEFGLKGENGDNVGKVDYSMGEECTPIIEWNGTESKPWFENYSNACVEELSNGKNIEYSNFVEEIIGNDVSTGDLKQSNDIIKNSPFKSAFASNLNYDSQNQFFHNLPANLTDGEEESGIFLDNRNISDNPNSFDYLKYNLSDLSLGYSRAIEISVRGAALKRDNGEYILRHDPDNRNYLKLENGKLKLKDSKDNDADTKLTGNNLNDSNLNDNNFYTVRFETNASKSKLKIKGTSIEDSNSSFTPDAPEEIYIGNLKISSSVHINQRNDIINFVRIYKKEDD